MPPVLVDVGAAGGPPAVWSSIARRSIYVGFDPDVRDFGATAGGGYLRQILLKQAITNRNGETRFYLTRFPHCSSTLKPDAGSLADFLFADIFEVTSEARVPATSLDSAVEGLSLPSVDWLKVDSQGIDLQIFLSLRPERRRRVLALDVEPGLIHAYHGEDLFVDVHGRLLEEGLWLSRLKVGGAIRLGRASLEELSKYDPRVDGHSIERWGRPAPAWCEARYLRTVAAMDGSSLGRREYALLSAFALIDEQWGFAFEVAVAYERRFGGDEVSRDLKRESARHLRELRPRPLFDLARRVLPAPLKSPLKRLIE